MPEGRLILCATPIGNLGDISDRLRLVLTEADVVYAEDTRRVATLLRHIGVTTKTRSFFEGNEAARTDEILEEVRSGMTVAIVSDAGMPAVSDPGARAVRRARDEGLAVTAVPGPSAVTTAVALAGFGGDRFVFEGFLPRKGGERSRRLAEIAVEQRPVVLFASPRRVGSDLADLARTAGVERRVVVARELTKLHEEVWAGSLGEAAERWGNAERGEFTLVVDGAESPAADIGSAVAMASDLVTRGSSLSEAARAASAESGVPRRRVYQALLDSRDAS